ncbi:MAG: glycosyltransferase family 4 protein [Desulfobacteraceae bacterium]|nr:glycosyltransferase family 4 protein [Desulfobacteraceae bacterium]MBC2718981.1 glycosyltransferase [Desulfobacteraceae bacterium]
MKVAFIDFIKENSPGLGKRMNALADGARQAGIDNVDFYYLNRLKHDTGGIVRYIKFREKIFPFNYFDFFFRRYRIIEKSVNLKRYDFIILRYPFGDPSGVKFTLKYNTITVHHSLEISRYKSYLKEKLSPLIRGLKIIRLKLEILFGPKILEHAKGIIGVTDEIRKAELSRINNDIPSAAISNGITVKNISHTGFKKFDGTNLDLVMIFGSINPWYGVDRIISAVNRYQGSVKITLHIIGNVIKSDLRHMASDFSMIKFHGFKNGKELDEIMKNMNLAICTLAFFRIDLNEACSLKTREYTARGIPFVLAYQDTDLQHVDKKYRFYLPMANNDSMIEMDQIINFAKHMSIFGNGESISDYMRAYALRHMDWSVKLKQYIEFVEELGDS